MDANKIDQHLNAVLRAAGSALRHYSLPKSLEDMRAAMKAAIDDATSELQARVAELESEKSTPEPIKCETCQGSGRIDERLGGYGFSNPSAICPDCDGLGEIDPPRDFCVTAPARLTDEQAEKADEAIREALGGALDCKRVWSRLGRWDDGARRLLASGR